jgi:signal recognition particle subunit SRP19
MVPIDDHRLIIWPIYFDINISRKNGRKISKKYSIDKPDIEKISKILKSLGIPHDIEKNTSHPFRPWKKDGRIIINKKVDKNKLINQISKLL